MIRAFNSLSEREQSQLYSLIRGLKPDAFPNLQAMRKAYLGVPYHQGDNQISYWSSGEVLGALALVTKEITTKGEAFIHAVFVSPSAQTVLRQLLVQALAMCPVENLKTIKLGLPPGRKDLAEIAMEQGFRKAYSMLELCYQEDNQKISLPPAFRCEGLLAGNCGKFREIINAAFRHSPNGAILTEEEVAELVEENAGSNQMGLCFWNDSPFGVYQVVSESPTAWIDTIGIHPDFQGKGLGAIVLHHCLSLLAGRSIKLRVVGTNANALRLYRRNGFNGESIIGDWFEAPNTLAMRADKHL